ncbi:right-handed parallel beta-helix repeat-containing protein, partial [Reyranella soli]|uniref:right-handed parallel beta-helix repeat-containing protein n=1 Tax=Reyranella soli TaxID=1230389 RepID=UPI0035A22F64
MSTGTEFGDILSAAIHGGYVAHLTDQTYTISSPIVIYVDSTVQGALGIDGGGATLVSQVTDGSPLIQIVVGPGVDFRYLTLSNFTLQGTGSDGNGIEIIADGNDRWAYNWTISDVAVHGVGGYGLSVVGSAFEGLVSDSWMNNNALGGAYFSHSANGGVASALRWFGGGAQDNGDAGIVLDNGARDLGVERARFANNGGAGISALSGITAVGNSTFENNGGAGIDFQNYGNFTDNVFSTSGRQTVGIDGFLAGTATLVGNSGSALADLQGSGVLFMTGNDGKVVTGPNLVPNATGGDMAHVTTGTAGVALPTLAAITAATTAAKPSSTGTGTVESALRAAIADGYVAHLTDATYTVTTPIVINVTRSSQGPVGIDLGGAKIISQIANGAPVIEIIVAPGADFGGLTLSNFSILGNGQEGDGIKIVADGADRSLHDWTISNVNIEHVGGIGLDVLGNASQGTVFNSWMHDDAAGGARFANSAGGGEVSALEWGGGGVRKNGVAGLILDNGARDLSVSGAYFVDNDGPGLMAPAGITSVRASGFENNLGSGAIVLGSASFAGDTFATYGRQPTAIGGYLSGDKIELTGVGNEYYGPGADTTVLANLQGQGTLAIAGGGNVVVGPNVAVTGLLAAEIEAQGATALVEIAGGYSLHPVGASTGPQIMYEDTPIAASASRAWLPIAAEPLGDGYQVAWKLSGADQYVVWTVDGDGNWLSQSGVLSGASAGLRSLEPGFHQDLNGDGSIAHTTVIEAAGSTALTQVANVYLLPPHDRSLGPQLTSGGSLITAGQYGGSWALIGGEQVGSGY